MANVWCVAYALRDDKGRIQRDELGKMEIGWCATKSGKGFNEATFSVQTKCDYFVILPFGKKKRMPTCPDCRRILSS
jgi:hypothetical protein